MNFMEAVKAMREGKKIRRKNWNDGHFWKISNKAKTEIVNSKDEGIDDWEEYKDKRVRCIYCKKPIHIDKFGGIKQEGLFCNDTFCLIALIKEQGDKEAEAQTQNNA